MEQLKAKHDVLKNATTTDKDRDTLSREGDKLREMLDQLRKQFGPPGSYGRPGDPFGGPPAGLFSAVSSAYQIYFCVKDKSDELGELKRQRIDSMAEFTSNSLKR